MKRKISTKIVSLVIVLTMLFSMSATTINVYATMDHTKSVDSIFDYVSLGASNTNGYGHDGYLPEAVYEDPLAASKAELNVYGYLSAPANAYPSLIADSLKKTYGEDNVKLHQLAISAMRVEEMRVLLDNNYYGDAFTEWRFTGGEKWFDKAEGSLKALREAYQSYITDAELITIDMGLNNFGVYAFNNIKTILAYGNYWKAPDFSQVEDVTEQIKYEKLKTSAMDYLKNNFGFTDEHLLGKLDKIADVLAYAALGSCYHFDESLEKIYELNPDANIVVINIQNLADDLVVEFEGNVLELGDLYGTLIQMVDDYRREGSPYAHKYMFANAGDVDTFLDEIVAWNGDPTTLGGDMKDCFDMYDDDLYVRSIVEYMLVGQALSGLFQGFRDMAAGYGLTVFVDDTKYTYEFALSRTPEQLLSLNLGALDLQNPAGDDADVEAYGQAVAAHLKNLRGDKANVSAYDYIFEDLLNGLEAQKAALLASVEGVPEEYYPAELVAGLAQLDRAINVIVPAAQAEFAAKLQGVYTTYHNTLNYAYDVVATFVQYVAKINTIEFGADSLNGFNSAANDLMGIIFNDFLNGAMNKFYYELDKNGIQATGAPDVPEYELDESIFEDNDALLAIAVLAVRYELGNSFFAHPNVKGNKQVTNAVLLALATGISHVYDNACDATCNVCGAIRGVPDHVYDSPCGGSCNICGTHIVPIHIYDNACDATCNICGSERKVSDHVDADNDGKCDYCNEKDINGDPDDTLVMAQQFRNEVAALNTNAIDENTYSNLYKALQTYDSLSNEEKVEVANEFATLQRIINDYNTQAEIANNELAEATEIAFAPIAASSFAFLSALWFVLRKKFLI